MNRERDRRLLVGHSEDPRIQKAYVERGRVREGAVVAGHIERGKEGLQRLLEKIYRERDFDFREYKETTLNRRLGRRLRARGVQTYTDYACVLDEDPGEYDKLFDDLTINVTGFFRDEAAFMALEEIALPALLHKNRETRRGLRIWSAGCATGEEAYSIAMLLLELSGGDICQSEAAVLATDIDRRALGRAREGVFSPKALEGIRPSSRRRYFVAENGGFRAEPAFRQMVTFEEHNLASDPPYLDVDLVVCRNVLIYFAPGLQTRVLKGFSEGLKDGGFLLLGRAEAPVGRTQRLFDCLDREAKLYRKAGH